tara:strand:- start:113 stop:313 length:201 start_codon:yes stop_codon:yes gene_type:complete
MVSTLQNNKSENDINKKIREKELLFYESIFETDERETIESMNSKNMLPFKVESKLVPENVTPNFDI